MATINMTRQTVTVRQWVSPWHVGWAFVWIGLSLFIGLAAAQPLNENPLALLFSLALFIIGLVPALFKLHQDDAEQSADDAIARYSLFHII